MMAYWNILLLLRDKHIFRCSWDDGWKQTDVNGHIYTLDGENYGNDRKFKKIYCLQN